MMNQCCTLRMNEKIQVIINTVRSSKSFHELADNYRSTV